MAEVEAMTVRNDLKLAMKRIEDLQVIDDNMSVYPPSSLHLILTLLFFVLHLFSVTHQCFSSHSLRGAELAYC